MDVKPPPDLINEGPYESRETAVTDVMDVKPPIELTIGQQYESRETTAIDVKPPAELINGEQFEQRGTTLIDIMGVKPPAKIDVIDDMDVKPPAELNEGKQIEPRETTVIDVKPPAELITSNGEQFEQSGTSLTDVMDVKPPAELTNEKQYEPRESILIDVMDVKPPAELINGEQQEQSGTTLIDVMDVKPPAELTNEKQYETSETLLTDVMDVKPPVDPGDTTITTIDIKPQVELCGQQFEQGEINKSTAINTLLDSTINSDKQTACEQTEDSLTNVMDIDSPHEYSQVGQEGQRNKTMTSFMYIEPTRDDSFLYCEDCQKTYKEHCPVHGPLVVVQNMKVEVNDPDRALHSLPTNLLVKQSYIIEAGVGVFTDTEIPPGTTYGPYEGMYITDPELAEGSRYCWQIYKDGKHSHFIDGKDTSSSNWMRYVNCAPSESEQNLVAFQYKGEIYYRCIKPILPKTELLVWYGNNCAQGLGIPMRNTDGTKETCMEAHAGESRIHTDNNCSNYEICEPIDKTGSSSIDHEYVKTGLGNQSCKCKLCGRIFFSVVHMKLHMKTHFKFVDKPYQCKVCEKAFALNSHLTSHMRTHSGEKPYICKFCNTAFAQCLAFVKHMHMHTVDKPYTCVICKKAFAEKHQLDTHMGKHKLEKSYTSRGECNKVLSAYEFHRHLEPCFTRPSTCEICEKTFAEKHQLDTHMRKHKLEKSYTCEKCKKTFAEKHQLDKHMGKHKLEKSYTCEICKEVFCKKIQLDTHYMKTHIKGKTSRSKGECNKVLNAYDIHRHLDPCYTQPLICKICVKTFTKDSTFKNHMRIHIGDKIYRCRICKKAFAKYINYKRHVNLHIELKPFKCQICNRAYSQSSTLKRHINLHIEDKPYKCHVCKKAFTLKSNLNRHMKFHTQSLD